MHHKPSRWPCAICDETKLNLAYPWSSSTSHHDTHVSRVCFKCWSRHLNTQLQQDIPTSEIACVFCDHKLVEADVKKLVYACDHARYSDKQFEEVLQMDSHFQRCLTDGCGFGYFVNPDDKQSGSIFTCHLCASQYCLQCEVPMHKGFSCGEFQEAEEERKKQLDQANEEEQSSLTFLKENAKQCPNCSSWIEKHGGCDHLTCKIEPPPLFQIRTELTGCFLGRKCMEEFCWVCLASYLGENGIMSIGNDAHDESCRYHSDRLPSAYDSDDDDDGFV